VRCDQLDLRRVHVGALYPQHPSAAGRAEEHVALAQQRLRATLVENHAGVRLRGHRKGDAVRDVGLDEARDHVDRRPLGGHHHVHAGRPADLAKTGDGVLHVVGRHHHEVGELVDHEQYVRQRPLALALTQTVEVPQLGRSGGHHEIVPSGDLVDHVHECVAGLVHVDQSGARLAPSANEYAACCKFEYAK